MNSPTVIQNSSSLTANSTLATLDIQDLLEAETRRQTDGLEMIASENYPSAEVLAIQGSIFNNKYAEGYPGNRYYGGCEVVDTIENLAKSRLETLFGCQASNVQPHSGSSANLAAMMALIRPGDTIMGMSLSHGGHLTHGGSFNFSGKFYRSVSYAVREDTHLLDYDAIRDLALATKPALIIAGASAYPRVIEFKKFAEIAQEVGALFLADIAHIAGLVAAHIHPSPVGLADVITSTTHKTLRGPRGGIILCKPQFAKKINAAVFPGLQGGPLMHVIAAKAVAFGEALLPHFRVYQHQIVKNCRALANELLNLGYQLITHGTDNHLLIIDLRQTPHKTAITGLQAQQWCESAGITLNKNSIPNDPHGTSITSGIRLGTPALTTRGMTQDHMPQIAAWIDQCLESKGDDSTLTKIKREVRDFCQQFPIHANSAQQAQN
jgi:glycine hydroxymethyltransferase